jgi:hypothetical protein
MAGKGLALRSPLFEIIGFSLMMAAFLTTVARVDIDQLIPASCLVSGLTVAVIIAGRDQCTLPVLSLGGMIGSLGLFLAAQTMVILLRHYPTISVPDGIIRLPRVLTGSLIFGIEGALVGVAVGSLSRTSKQLRLPFAVVIFVVWGLFFTAYAYCLG